MADLCVAGNQTQQPLCEQLQSYHVECQEAGVKVGPWRNHTGCAHCPQFSHYSLCANTCSSLCPGAAGSVPCPDGCEEGCQRDQWSGLRTSRAVWLLSGWEELLESRPLLKCTMICTCGASLVCEPFA
nr:alpha-tectorin-like [Oncorhynchus nerka]